MTENHSSTNDQFTIHFWGTRGTRCLIERENSEFGSQTICVEVRCGSRVLVFDAGSGFVRLGRRLLSQKKSKKIDLFFTHAHYDHVEGIPHFGPFYEDSFKCDVWAGTLKGVESTREIFDFLMMEPYFPISIEKFKAELKFNDIKDAQILDLDDGIIIKTFRLDHPGGSTGYRVEYQGKSFGFITDTTHTLGQTDANLVNFLKKIDLFAYDCSYTDEEFPSYSTYGHSTWQEAIRLKEKSGAKKFLGLHHMPFRTDKELLDFESQLRETEPDSGFARDGMEIDLLAG